MTQNDTTTRTIPSTTLGEYLGDVERFYAATEDPLKQQQRVRDALAASVERGLAGKLNEWYGPDVAETYLHDLFNHAKEQHRAEREVQAQQRLEELKRHKEQQHTAKDEPKPPKKQRTDRLYNERRMRDAILDVVKPNGWTDKGVRALGRLAAMPHRTARDVLERMVKDLQVERDRREDKWGNRHGFKVLREHPCWSQHKTAQFLSSGSYPPS